MSHTVTSLVMSCRHGYWIRALIWSTHNKIHLTSLGWLFIYAGVDTERQILFELSWQYSVSGLSCEAWTSSSLFTARCAFTLLAEVTWTLWTQREAGTGGRTHCEENASNDSSLLSFTFLLKHSFKPFYSWMCSSHRNNSHPSNWWL